MLDFADPDLAFGGRKEGQERHEDDVDEVAEPMVDRKAILREQKLKRKQQELEKKREQEYEKQMKERRMVQLEMHLK